MTLGDRIKKVRRSLDLTQREFAEQIGTTQNTIANYEIGHRNPSAAAFNNICKTFNVSEEWLRNGGDDDRMFVQQSQEDELAAAVDRLLSGESSEFKRRLVVVLSKLDEKEWEMLEKRLNEITAAKAEPAFAPTLVPAAHTPTIEEEARAEAEQQTERIYQQILSEKKAAAGL